MKTVLLTISNHYFLHANPLDGIYVFNFKKSVLVQAPHYSCWSQIGELLSNASCVL